ncbi:MFS transporter [Marinobacter halophilus]|uniref:MFS transporter n=1 Tax=Marinobacter halophilus TaxID=1323740 RepID=A0A2T1KG01_9GAMM|nr:MFS transporter [Marinobacter halophilus]PSF08980.1 MFS transporter [Marinobacter halophilus]
MFPAFMRENPRLALFAVLATASSGFGQTFFFSVFGGGIRDTFALQNSTYGLIYSLATLASAILLLKLGPLADRWSLNRVTTLAVVILATGCLTIALTPHWLLLIPGFLLARLGGQGLMGHIGLTTAGRYFSTNRGRIMALTSGGFPIAEAILPLSAGLILAASGWRMPWFIATGLLLVVLLPLLLYLSRHATHPVVLSGNRSDHPHAQAVRPDYNRSQVLRDPGFYLILPAALIVPFTVTAVLFHQSAFAEVRGWSTEQIGLAFTGFAAGHIVSLFFGGPLVDRIGAQRALSYGLAPIFCSMLVLGLSDFAWTPNLYLALCGISLGFIGAAAGAIWPERYGVGHIGAIRSVAQASMVFSTALSPILVGVLLDFGIATTGIGVLFAVLILLSAILALVATAPKQRA